MFKICKCSKKNEKPISFSIKKRIVFAGGGIVAKYAKTIGFGKTIFAFLMLNTMTSAHNKILGAKFLSFERLEAIRLYTACYAVLLSKRYKIRLAKPYFFLL